VPLSFKFETVKVAAEAVIDDSKAKHNIAAMAVKLWINLLF
jgi:hypothetical protein